MEVFGRDAFAVQAEAPKRKGRMAQETEVKVGERERVQLVHVRERDGERDRAERLWRRERSTGKAADERGQRSSRRKTSDALLESLVVDITQIEVLVERSQCCARK